MQVGLAVGVARERAEVALDLLEGAVDVDARVGLVVGLPHRHRAAPEAVAGDRPVAGVLQPAAELAVLDVPGHPVDLLVELEHPLLDRGDLDEPRRDALVDQGLAAAPAVRVGVVVGLAAQQDRAGGDRAGLGLVARSARTSTSVESGGGLEVVDDLQVGVEDPQAGVVGDGVGEPAVLADRHDRLDALAVGDLLVDLTERAGGVHEADTVGGGDGVVGGDHAERTTELLAGVVGVVGERRVVGATDQLGAGVAPQDGRLVGVGEELALVRRQPGLGDDVLRLLLGPRHGAFHDDVVDLGADHHGQVAGQGPRGGRPDEQVGAVEHLVLAGRVHPQADGDGRVLDLLVDVVVHPQLVVGQRRLVVPAVGQDAEALVDQALVPQRLERPDDRLHVVGVHRLVVVVEVDPAGLAGDVVAPLAGVLHDRLAAGVVELLDAELDDLVGGLDAVQTHRLELGGQAVGVPAEAALDTLAAHRLVARDEVLDVAGQQVAVVRQAVGERRTVVEDELVLAALARVALVDGGLEGAVGGPVGQHPLLDLREARAAGDRRGVGVGDLGVRHRCCPCRLRRAARPVSKPTRTTTSGGGCRGTTSFVLPTVELVETTTRSRL